LASTKVVIPAKAGIQGKRQWRLLSARRAKNIAGNAEGMEVRAQHRNRPPLRPGLARLFKQSLGVSPHQYLIQVRVNSARWLLSAGSGERSLAEVATAVGFADQSHLTRHFQRMTGVTPGQFRP
jgi:methylphosphotriester-DNA--protein-cysteine methyltransferase